MMATSMMTTGNPLANWLQVRETTHDATLNELRDRAETWLQESALPTTRDEEWRFTDLSPIATLNAVAPPELQSRAVESLCIDAEVRLVFANGRYNPTLSNLDAPPDCVYVGSWAEASETIRDRVAGAIARQTNAHKPFAALNAASTADLGIVWIGAGAIVETPISLMSITESGGHDTIVNTRFVVVAEANSSATIVEEFLTVGIQEGEILSNAAIDLHLADNADIQHVTIQREAETSSHIHHLDVTQSRDSRYASHIITLGSVRSRQQIDVVQTGSGTATTLNSLSMINGTQLADTHTSVVLQHPHSTIDQLCKNIVGDRARAVFDGRIVVAQPAQQTRADQLNRNLLLSPQARVNTKPQLEIVADDVKCSHGATVSQLEEDELFYLQSRGLDRQLSMSLLVDAFAAEILETLPIASVRDAIMTRISRIDLRQPIS
jgi:Fe-S cluster assembly protein SufD